MDRGAWQAAVYRVAESGTTESLTLSLSYMCVCVCVCKTNASPYTWVPHLQAQPTSVRKY